MQRKLEQREEHPSYRLKQPNGYVSPANDFLLAGCTSHPSPQHSAPLLFKSLSLTPSTSENCGRRLEWSRGQLLWAASSSKVHFFSSINSVQSMNSSSLPLQSPAACGVLDQCCDQLRVLQHYKDNPISIFMACEAVLEFCPNWVSGIHKTIKFKAHMLWPRTNWTEEHHEASTRSSNADASCATLMWHHELWHTSY